MFSSTPRQDPWIALAIGNSRLHWAKFIGQTPISSWDTPHRDRVWQPGERTTTEDFDGNMPLWIASVVSQQLQFWKTYPQVQTITLDRIPLQGLYPTLGIDRALAAWGAGNRWGWPVLVIDGGTALTFTGVDARPQLVGGAILPGVGLQLRSLARNTDSLPQIDSDAGSTLPRRWALDTPGAIRSGVLYAIVAGAIDFIEAWWREFPQTPVVFTGGDRQILANAIALQFPDIAKGTIVDEHLIFWGMREIVLANR